MSNENCLNWKQISGGIAIGAGSVLIFISLSILVFGFIYSLFEQRSIEETIDDAVKEIAKNAEQVAIQEVIRQANSKFEIIRNDIKNQVNNEFRKEADKLKVKIDDFIPQIEEEVNRRIVAAESQIKDQVNREIAKIKSQIEKRIDKEVKEIKEQAKKEAKDAVIKELNKRLDKLNINRKKGAKCAFDFQCKSANCKGILGGRKCV